MFAQHVESEPEAFQRSGRKVLSQHVHLLDQIEEHRLAALVLEVERDTALVGVEQDEVVGVGAGLFGRQPAALIPRAGTFQLDHVRAQPGQDLGA